MRTKTTTLSKRIWSMLLATLMVMGIFVSAGMLTVAADSDTYKFENLEIVYETDATGANSLISPAQPASLKPGQVWTGKKVEDNRNGTFTVTLYAWGAKYTEAERVDDGTYTNPGYPMNGELTVTDTIGANFHLTGGLDGNTFEWKLTNEQITGDKPVQTTYTIQLNSVASGTKTGVTYETGTATANFKASNDNPYYWTLTPKKDETTYKVDINWRNNEDTNALVTLTLYDSNNSIELKCGNTEGKEWVSLETFSNYLASPPLQNGVCTKPIMYYDESIKGSGDEKTYVIWIAEYNTTLKCYEVYSNEDVLNPDSASESLVKIFVGGNGGNNKGVHGFTKTTHYTEKQPTSNNTDGKGNISLAMPNKGWITLKDPTPQKTTYEVNYWKNAENVSENKLGDENGSDLEVGSSIKIADENWNTADTKWYDLYKPESEQSNYEWQVKKILKNGEEIASTEWDNYELELTVGDNKIDVIYELVYVAPQAQEVTLTKSVDTAKATGEGTFTYTLDIENKDMYYPANVTVIDGMFVDAKDITVLPEATVWDWKKDADGITINNTIEITGLKPTESVQIIYSVVLNNEAFDTPGADAQPKEITNEAEIKWMFIDPKDGSDKEGGQDEDDKTVTIDPKNTANPAVSKVAIDKDTGNELTNLTVKSGDEIIYKVVVTNKDAGKKATVALKDSFLTITDDNLKDLTIDNITSTLNRENNPLPAGESILDGDEFVIYPNEEITIIYTAKVFNQVKSDALDALAIIEPLRVELAVLTDGDKTADENSNDYLSYEELETKRNNAETEYKGLLNQYNEALSAHNGGVSEAQEAITEAEQALESARAELAKLLETASTIELPVMPEAVVLPEDEEEAAALLDAYNAALAEYESQMAEYLSLQGQIEAQQKIVDGLEADLLELAVIPEASEDLINQKAELDAMFTDFGVLETAYEARVLAINTLEGEINEEYKKISADGEAIAEDITLVNSITLEGFDIGGEASGVIGETKTVDATVAPTVESALAVSKTVTKKETLENGDIEVTYNVVVKNLGNTTITDITLVDTFVQLGTDNSETLTPDGGKSTKFDLAAGTSETFTYTKTIDFNESYVNYNYYNNTAKAIYTITIDGEEIEVEDESSAAVTVPPQQSANITVDKTSDAVEGEVTLKNDVAVVKYTVTVTSDMELTEAQENLIYDSLLTDVMNNGETAGYTLNEDDLFSKKESDGKYLYIWNYSVTFTAEGTYRNVVTLSPSPEDGLTGGGKDDETVKVNPEPYVNLIVSKNVAQYNGGEPDAHTFRSAKGESALTIDNGARAFYEITIQNTGSAPADITMEEDSGETVIEFVKAVVYTPVYNEETEEYEYDSADSEELVSTVPAGGYVKLYYLSEQLNGNTQAAERHTNVVTVTVTESEDYKNDSKTENLEDTAEVIVPVIGTYSVTVRYLDTLGNELQSNRVYSTTLLNGEEYEASGLFARTISANGRTYTFLRGDELTGRINGKNVVLELIYNYIPTTTTTEPTTPEDTTPEDTTPEDTTPETISDEIITQVITFEPFTYNASNNDEPSNEPSYEPSIEESVEESIEESVYEPEEEEENIEDEEPPMAAPEEPKLDATQSAQTAAKVIMEELEEFEDDETPTDSMPDLPKTGGLSGILTALAGLGLFGAGATLNKKKKDDDNQ